MIKEKSLIRNTAVVGAGTFLSRITGLVREILVSSSFGASWITDAFFIAYTIPNLLRRLFAEGALSTSVVPVFSQYTTKGKKQTQEFILAVFSGLTLVVCLICVVGVLISPWIVNVVGVGFRGDAVKIQLATNMTRIMFPFLLLISWSALVMGILNTIHIFSWSAIAPVFFNAGIIGALLFLKSSTGSYSLALGVIVGGFGQFAIQLIPFYKKGFRLGWIKKFWYDSGFKEVISLMLPVSFALAVGQINILVDRVIASTCQEGAVSALYYADRLLELPLGIFGIALSTAILPPLSRLNFENDQTGWKETFYQGLRLVVFIMVPIMIFLSVFRFESVKIVYQRGLFDAIATAMTSQGLLFYAPGLVFFSLNHIITKAFYSLKDTVTPVRVSVIMVGINVVLDLLLVRYMSFGGLALATSIVAVLNFVFLYLFFKKKHSILEGDRTIKPWTEKVLLLNVAFGLLCFLMLGFFQGIHHNLILIGFYLLVVFALSLFYIILSFFLGINEGKAVLSFIVKRIRRKAWGGDVVE